MSSSFNHQTSAPHTRIDTMLINTKSLILPSINEENLKFPSLSQYSTQARGCSPAKSPTFNITLPSINKLVNSTDTDRRLSLPSIHTLPIPQPDVSTLESTTHPFTCSAPDCHWKFKRHEHLKRHIATTHAKKRPFHCPVDGCMKSFSRSDNFSVHLKTHTSTTTTSPVPYPDLATQQYARRGSLPNFGQNIPPPLVLPSQRMTEKGQYHSEISFSGQHYPQMQYLANGQVHPLTVPPPPHSPVSLPSSGPPPTIYHSSSAARTPVPKSGKEKKAPGEKPLKIHQCMELGCGMKFRRAEHLKRHGRVHTMERPFSCTFPGCLKTFSRSDNLNQHARIHLRKGGYQNPRIIPIQPVMSTKANSSSVATKKAAAKVKTSPQADDLKSSGMMLDSNLAAKLESAQS